MSKLQNHLLLGTFLKVYLAFCFVLAKRWGLVVRLSLVMFVIRKVLRFLACSWLGILRGCKELKSPYQSKLTFTHLQLGHPYYSLISCKTTLGRMLISSRCNLSSPHSPSASLVSDPETIRSSDVGYLTGSYRRHFNNAGESIAPAIGFISPSLLQLRGRITSLSS